MPDIKNVEIMRTGVWNRDKFTLAHLKAMAENFKKLDYRVPVKLGHTRDPGAPAYGWLANVRLAGEKLVADFTDVPAEIVEMIKKKMFDTVSSEIYFNLLREGKTYNRALKAVALLGANIPAVAGLKPLSSSLSFDDDCDAVMEFGTSLNEEYASFMAKHGEEEITLGVSFLKKLNYNLSEDDAKGIDQTVSFRLEALPNELVDGLLSEFGLDDKSDNLFENCRDRISSLSDLSGATGPLCSLLCRRLAGEFPSKPKKQEIDMDLIKLLAQAIAFRSKSEKEADVLKEFAEAAGMKVKAFSELLDGKGSIELSDDQAGKLVEVMTKAPADKGDGDDPRIAALELKLKDSEAKNTALEGDNEQVKELSAEIETLKNESRERAAKERVAKVKIPSLRASFQGLYELAAKTADKVRLYDTDGKEFKELSAAEVLDELVDQINQKLSHLFTEQSDGGHDYDLENSSSEGAGAEADKLAVAYQDKHEDVSYEVALQKVLEADPDLNKRYAQEG